jgi:hypothetical protein
MATHLLYPSRSEPQAAINMTLNAAVNIGLLESMFTVLTQLLSAMPTGP